MEKFTLSHIENKWLEEKTSREITELPDNFYERASAYATEIKKELGESEELRRDLLREELKHVLEMVQEIYLFRTLKMMDDLFDDEKANLLDSERQTFDRIRRSLESLREELIEPIVEGELELEPPKETSNDLILISFDIPESITASDLRYYGPFEEGDIVNMPSKSAELLAQQGLARILEVRRAY